MIDFWDADNGQIQWCNEVLSRNMLEANELL